MPCIGISQMSSHWIENGIETGYEHFGGDFRIEQFIGSCEHFARRSCRLGSGTKDGAGGSHKQSCWDTFTSNIAYDKTQASIIKWNEIVEIATDLTGRLVIGFELPTVDDRNIFGQKGVLNFLRGAQFLLKTFVFTQLYLLCLYQLGDA